MSYYGIVLTRRGRELISKLLATKKPLELDSVMVGEGACPDGTFPGELEDLVEPVAAGSSTVPSYERDTIRMTVEYRSDMNGGIGRGFWLKEFGVFAKDPAPEDPAKSKVLLIYGCLGDYPQYVSAYDGERIDTRRFPIAVVVGEGLDIHIDFSPEAFMTAEDVEEYCITVMLPKLQEELRKLIAEHDASVSAHPDLRRTLTEVDSRLTLIEMMFNKEVNGNPFSVTFTDLEGVTLTDGIWNTAASRIEF